MIVEPTTTPLSILAPTPVVLTNLAQLGYTDMIPVQAASLPVALAGHDPIAQAKTGSGKTVALMPAPLTRLDARSFGVQAMVLYPTRELADQVTQEIRRLARTEEDMKVLALCGGTPMCPQAASLEHGAHVIVGTPGHIMDHLEHGDLRLGILKTLMLDKADHTLDMGFFGDIATAVRRCPADRRTLLFSATYPGGIAKLSQRTLRNPKEVKLEEHHDDNRIRQRFYEVIDSRRLHVVGQLLGHYWPVGTLAFYNTKQQRQDLLGVLRAQDIHALTLHGGLE